MKLKKMTPYEIHRELFELSKEIKRICEENHIQFYLGFGSMLGAIRDGGFIPWDDDMDFFVLREDWNRFNNCVLSFLDKEKYFVINAITRKEYPKWAYVTKVGINGTYRRADYLNRKKTLQSGIYLDVFVLENVVDNTTLLKLQQFGLKVIDEQINKKTWKQEWLRKMSFPGKVLEIIAGSKWNVETCNIVRDYIQTSLDTYNASKVLVPMGPLGKYPLEKILFEKEWFKEKKEVPFKLLKENKVVDILYLPIPVEYEKILEITYGKWKERPRGKRPKGVSYWIK